MENIKNTLLEIGGKVWTKGNLNRIYLGKDAIIKYLNLSKLTEFELTSLQKSKTFFDVNEEKFYSDVGTVRVLFNQNGSNCRATKF